MQMDLMCDSTYVWYSDVIIYIRVNKKQALGAEKSHKLSAHQTTLLQYLFSCFLNQVGLISPTALTEIIFLSAPLCHLENRSVRKNKAHEALQLYIFTKIFLLCIFLMVTLKYIYFFFPPQEVGTFHKSQNQNPKAQFPFRRQFWWSISPRPCWQNSGAESGCDFAKLQRAR